VREFVTKKGSSKALKGQRPRKRAKARGYSHSAKPLKLSLRRTAFRAENGPKPTQAVASCKCALLREIHSATFVTPAKQNCRWGAPS